MSAPWKLTLGALVAVALATLAWVALPDQAVRLPLCSQAPANWQCWTPTGGAHYGELPTYDAAYWDDESKPRRFTREQAIRRAKADADFDAALTPAQRQRLHRAKERRRRAEQRRAR